jgi:hypothetical protein
MSGADTVDFALIPEQPIATEIAGLWNTWNGSRSEWRARVEENKKYVYATSTRETTNVSNPHNHSTHIPKISQIFDNLSANYTSALFPHEDWLKFVGNDPIAEQFDKKRAVLAYINTKHRLNNFQNVMQQLVNDWILTGNAFAGVTYVAENHIDPETGQVYQGYVGPKVYRISPDDIVFNPLATDFRSAPKIIRSIKTLGELHRDLEENPTLGYSQEIIDTVTQNREVLKNFTDTSINKHIQMEYDGFGSASVYFKSGYVEILEFYGDIYDTDAGVWYKNHVITVVDRQYVIRNEPLNTWSGRPHIFHCGWRIRPDNLWAMGPLDNLVGMQYLIDHLENARADAFDQMIDPDRVIKGDVDIEVRGAAIDYYVNDPSIGGDVRYLTPDTTVLNADFQIQRKESQMEEYAGAPREAMGIRTPGEKTAFEVSSLQNAASRIFQNKITYFESAFMEPIINAEVEEARRNINGTDIVRILDDDFGVAEFMRITQADLTSNGTLIPMGARHFARQATLVQNLMQFSQAMVQDPMMMQHFPAENLARAWEDLLGFKRLELYRKYGRTEEEVELARIQSVAQQQLQTEQAMMDQRAMQEQPVQ